MRSLAFRSLLLQREIGAAATSPAYPTAKHWFIVDGKYHDLKHGQTVHGTTAFAPALNQSRLEILCSRLDVEQLGLKILHASDLTPISFLPRLKGLSIEYAPKLVNVVPLTKIPTLEVLRLADSKNLRDYAPLAGSTLQAIALEGGMWRAHEIRSVAPFAAMPNLEELSLDAIGIAEGGLRPLTASRSLKLLTVPYQLPLNEYATVKALRPDLLGANFSLFQKVEAFEGKDLVLVARHRSRRRSFSSGADAAKVTAINEEFDTLVREERRSAGA